MVSIPLNDIKRSFVEGGFQCRGMPSLCLAGNVVYLPIDEIILVHALQVAHTAANEAVKHKDVTLHGECRAMA